MKGLEAIVCPSQGIITSSSREEPCVSGTVLIGWDEEVLDPSNIVNKVSAPELAGRWNSK